MSEVTAFTKAHSMFKKRWTLKGSIDCIWLSNHRPWQSMLGGCLRLTKICDPAPPAWLRWSENWAMGSIYQLSRQYSEGGSLNSSRGRMGQWPRAIHILCLSVDAKPGYSFSLYEQTLKRSFCGIILQPKENNMLSRGLRERADL